MKKFVYGILAIFTLSFIGIGIWQLHVTQQEKKTLSRVRGQVVELQAITDTDGRVTYAPEVTFNTASGELITFISSISSNPPAYRVGQEVDMLYNPNNPQEAQINSFWSLYTLPGIFLIVGVLFLVVMLIMFLQGMLFKRKVELLKRSGRHVMAYVTNIEENTMISVNGKHPFRILAQWKDPTHEDVVHIFKSQNIWFDPREIMRDKKEISVYIDSQKPKKYYVDISFLPRVI